MAKKNVVILHNNQEARQIMTSNLEVYTNCAVEQHDKLGETIGLLKEKDFSKVDLIILPNYSSEQNTSQQLENLLMKNAAEIPMIVLGKYSAKRENTVVIEEPFTVKDVLSKAAKKLSITAKKMVNLKTDDYYSYPLRIIHPGVKLAASVFTQESGEYKELLGPGKTLHAEVIELLRGRGLTELFIKSEDRLKFINKVTDYYINLLDCKSLNPENRIATIGTGFNHIHSIAEDIGITEQVRELTVKSIDAMQEQIGEIDSLNQLLNTLLANNLSYKYKHSLLTMFICKHIIEEMEWGHQDQQNILSFVAFFHDIYLKEDRWAKISSNSDVLLDQSLSESDKKTIMNHAKNAAKFLLEFPQLPVGAASIIRQHHGAHDGVGFKMSSKHFAPLTIVFIVAERWSDTVLDAQDKNMGLCAKDVLVHLGHLYKKNQFKKVINCLRTLNFDF